MIGYDTLSFFKVKPYWIYVLVSLSMILLTACTETQPRINYPVTDLSKAPLIPKPLQVTPTGTAFGLDAKTVIFTDSTVGFLEVGQLLANSISARLPFKIPINPKQEVDAPRTIRLQQCDTLPMTSPEAYRLNITNNTVLLQARTAEGAFRGMQTLKQLIPEQRNDTLAKLPMWLLPSGTIRDTPNFPYRGVMLDVARHFFSVEEVKQFLEVLAYYKYNTLHLHLTDDQGWRIQIASWPKLTQIGARTEVGGSMGGFYTQEDFKELVAYAAERHIVIIPEVDMPGHTNAANLSYPIFHAKGRAETPRVRTDMKVGYSSFDTRKDTLYQFLDEVIEEITTLTPGPYFHIGGDESMATPKKDYINFIEKVTHIVNSKEKYVIGWNEIAQADLPSTAVVQFWNDPKIALKAAQKGLKVILSPAKKIYLDMKYDSLSKHGLDWAGHITVKDAYDWDPETYIPNLPEAQILGLEAPLWSETIADLTALEYLAFPRAIGYAELGWTPKELRHWEDYRLRLAAQKPYLKRRNIQYYPSPNIDW
ncbi:MAG: beta-N-acetylhexosaminidase [Bacteroidota bacterium]